MWTTASFFRTSRRVAASLRHGTDRPLHIEPLEDRTVLSTLSVWNAQDQGPGSLRQAILDANARDGADKITFAPSARGEIELSAALGELTITDDLAIRGPGRHHLTISGEGVTRVFSVLPDPTDPTGRAPEVTFRQLTIANGLATDAPGLPPGFAVGGGVFNLGATVHLDRVTMTGNRSEGWIASGGAVGNFTGSLTVTASRFSDNTSVGVSIGLGGAIGCDLGDLAVSHGRFEGNTAMSLTREVLPDDPLAAFAGNSSGGAISSIASAATVDHSRFRGNLVVGGAGVGSEDGGTAFGGAVYSNSDFSPFGQRDGTLEVTRGTFLGNTALGGDGGPDGGAGGTGSGGAVAMAFEFFGNTGTISHSLVKHNRASGGAGGHGGGSGGSGIGGGIASLAGAIPRVEYVTLIHNVAQGGDGGSGGGNGGDGKGGAIGLDIIDVPGFEALLPSIDLAHSRLVRNEAIGGNGNDGAGGDGQGGGLMVQRGTANIQASSFARNTAVGGAGRVGGDGQGGGLYNDESTTTLARSAVLANRARGGTGDSGVSGLGQGGGIFNGDAGMFEVDDLALLGIRFNTASDDGDDVFGTLTRL